MAKLMLHRNGKFLYKLYETVPEYGNFEDLNWFVSFKIGVSILIRELLK